MMHYLMAPARRVLAILAFLTLAATPPIHASPEIDIGDVTGTGWKAVVGCIGCGVGAIAIATGGPAAIIAAIHVPGGGLIAAGCVAVCMEAAA